MIWNRNLEMEMRKVKRGIEQLQNEDIKYGGNSRFENTQRENRIRRKGRWT